MQHRSRSSTSCTWCAAWSSWCSCKLIHPDLGCPGCSHRSGPWISGHPCPTTSSVKPWAQTVIEVKSSETSFDLTNIASLLRKDQHTKWVIHLLFRWWVILHRTGSQYCSWFPDLLDAESEINPVITLTVRAYDDGIPSLSAEVPVHIFTEDVSSRMMRFIVPQGRYILMEELIGLLN